MSARSWSSSLVLMPLFVFTYFAVQQQPIIVKIVEPKEESLYDVLFGALGLTGVMTLIAVVAAIAFAGVLFWIRSRSTRNPDETKVTSY